MGRAGIVLGLEVSRLARNSTDWHRLLETCAITDTLILDEDGIYYAGDFNDRLLLGLKGTISEAEFHLIRARMRGGMLNKAKRGELQTPLPFGSAYDDEGRVVLDPDQQVQQATINRSRPVSRGIDKRCATRQDLRPSGTGRSSSSSDPVDANRCAEPGRDRGLRLAVRASASRELKSSRAEL